MGEAEQRLEELDAAINALDHESRRHILLVVWFRGGTMSAGEIAARFSCTWPTTSRHLRVLEAAGLLEFEKQGRTRVYRVNTRKLHVVREWLQWFEVPEQQKTASEKFRQHLKLQSVKQVPPRPRKRRSGAKRMLKRTNQAK